MRAARAPGLGAARALEAGRALEREEDGDGERERGAGGERRPGADAVGEQSREHRPDEQPRAARGDRATGGARGPARRAGDHHARSPDDAVGDADQRASREQGGRPPASARTTDPSTTKPPAQATSGRAPTRSASRPSGSVITTIANVVVESRSAVSSGREPVVARERGQQRHHGDVGDDGDEDHRVQRGRPEGGFAIGFTHAAWSTIVHASNYELDDT